LNQSVRVLLVTLCFLLFGGSPLTASDPIEVPVKGMVTMVDLGADKCIPCKMMAPIIEKVRKDFAGRAAIVFLDVWKDSSHGRRFGIRAIPTQIFFDAEGNEVFRHTGFLDEERIIAKLYELGVPKLEASP
jgi:thioredoxin 1